MKLITLILRKSPYLNTDFFYKFNVQNTTLLFYNLQLLIGTTDICICYKCGLTPRTYACGPLMRTGFLLSKVEMSAFGTQQKYQLRYQIL